jgi:hypothetical protein
MPRTKIKPSTVQPGSDQIDEDWLIEASHLEQSFAALWSERYPQIDLCAEYEFAERRKLRLDFVHLPSKTAIEIQGGIYNPSHSHSSGSGIESDCDKALLAATLGWQVLHLTEALLTVEGCDRVYKVIQLRSRGAQNQTPMETSN